MTPAERKRHAAAILKLRAGKLARRRAGYRERGQDSQAFEVTRRRTYNATNTNVAEQGISPVDQMFEARSRAGWLPKGCWR